ncbi:MAG: glucosidase, partial [Blastocatellia bacterium]|nr:glucosidase [Blastocatellia bacterium]
MSTKELERLNTKLAWPTSWKRWGPYVSERSWGTVREDYSPDGNAWDYLPHDKARSKAYRWGEDGIAGICDRYQLMVFSLALWNGRDPILKERLFGVVPSEGNHGEDVKEYYFYLDSTPTHSYMKILYKYPQDEYPYWDLIKENQRRAGRGMEYELLDTGIFDNNRYFDVFVEYAKASPEDISIKIEVFNRGDNDSTIHILPHLWFRNTWAWGQTPSPEPLIKPGPTEANFLTLYADDSSAEMLKNLPFSYKLGPRYLYADAGGQLLFTNNETNAERVYGSRASSRSRYTKDAFHRYIIQGEKEAVNPELFGTKSCIHYKLEVPAHSSVTVRLRLTPDKLVDPLSSVDQTIVTRKKE